MDKKKKVIELLNKCDCADLAGRINTQGGNWLKAFFTWKTHKTELPFRPIISENECWQGLLGGQIQIWLGYLEEPGIFSLKSSQELIPWLESNHKSDFKVASLDATDMYFNINVKEVLLCIRRKINKNPIVFQNKSKVTEENLIKCIELYLSSTIIKDNGTYYTQKDGFPIGSKVSPRVSELFMNLIDEEVAREMKQWLEEELIYIRRYIDDIILFYKNLAEFEKIRELYQKYSLGISFTTEFPSNDIIQFLEFKIDTSKGLCFKYSQRSEKPLVPYLSNHSRKVLDGVIINSLANALNKSCECLAEQSLGEQEKRLTSAGYPDFKILECKRKALRPNNRKIEDEFIASTGMPQVHGTTHRIAKRARKHRIRVSGTHRNKLSSMCRITNELIENKKVKDKCEKHINNVFPCHSNSIYEIALSCGASYIGETGKCPNVRLGEHQSGTAKYSNFVMHRDECGCNINEKDCKLLVDQNIKGQHARRVFESLEMEERRKQNPELIISSPSLKISKWERITAVEAKKEFLKVQTLKNLGTQ
jgi:hypothetical protein